MGTHHTFPHTLIHKSVIQTSARTFPSLSLKQNILSRCRARITTTSSLLLHQFPFHTSSNTILTIYKQLFGWLSSVKISVSRMRHLSFVVTVMNKIKNWKKKRIIKDYTWIRFLNCVKKIIKNKSRIFKINPARIYF